jgi:hypothetical protein
VGLRRALRRAGDGTLRVSSRSDRGGCCGRSSMAELQPSKLVMRVRFPSPAPAQGGRNTVKAREGATAQGSQVEDRGRAPAELAARFSAVCSEPEAHPLQAVRGLAAALSHANATGNPGGLRFARRLGRSPLDGHCGPAAPRRLHPRGRRTQVLTVFRLPAGGAVRQGSRSSRSRRHPLVTELVLGRLDEGSVRRAGRVVDRVTTQVNDIVVPGGLRPGGGGHSAGSSKLAGRAPYPAADPRMAAAV